MSQEYITLKLYHGLELLSQNRYVSDLSNEELNIYFDHGDAKILVVKVGGQKKISADSARFDTDAPGVGQSGRYFFLPPNFASDIFAAPLQK